jgi:3-dehydroquinate dehydratase
MTDIGGSTGPALPSTLIVPITLWERLSGTTVDYSRMTPCRTLPKTEVITEYLQYWSYQKQIIKFLGATSDREVKIDYLADNFSVAEDASDRINLFNAKSFLSYRTAALAADFQGENEERATKLNANAQNALDKLLNLDIKNQQNMPARRRPFRASWKSRGIN